MLVIVIAAPASLLASVRPPPLPSRPPFHRHNHRRPPNVVRAPPGHGFSSEFFPPVTLLGREHRCWVSSGYTVTLCEEKIIKHKPEEALCIKKKAGNIFSTKYLIQPRRNISRKLLSTNNSSIIPDFFETPEIARHYSL